MKSKTALFFSASGKALIYQQLRQDETDQGTATEVCICAAQTVCLTRWLLLTTVVSVVLVSLLQLHQHLQPPLLLLIIVLQLCVLLYRCHHKVVSERLLLVGGLGAQVTTIFISGRSHVSFVPWASLVDVIIAETISMQQVLHYTALLVRPDSGHLHLRLLPLFLTWWPRLTCLRQVYQSCQRVLTRRGTVPHAFQGPVEGVPSSPQLPLKYGGSSRSFSNALDFSHDECLPALLKESGGGASDSGSGVPGGAPSLSDVAYKTRSMSRDISETSSAKCHQASSELGGLKKRKSTSSYARVDWAPVLKKRRILTR